MDRSEIQSNLNKSRYLAISVCTMIWQHSDISPLILSQCFLHMSEKSINITDINQLHTNILSLIHYIENKFNRTHISGFESIMGLLTHHRKNYTFNQDSQLRPAHQARGHFMNGLYFLFINASMIVARFILQCLNLLYWFFKENHMRNKDTLTDIANTVMLFLISLIHGLFHIINSIELLLSISKMYDPFIVKYFVEFSNDESKPGNYKIIENTHIKKPSGREQRSNVNYSAVMTNLIGTEDCEALDPPRTDQQYDSSLNKEALLKFPNISVKTSANSRT